MRCPICGAKMIGKQICPYCNVTDEQIANASNKKVKEYRKSGNTDMIHYTTIIPKDVQRWKLILYTILLGWLGINHYYINRPVRGTYSLVSTMGLLLIIILGLLGEITSTPIKIMYNIIYELFGYMTAINVVLWACNIISLVFKSFKIPVVLGKKE